MTQKPMNKLDGSGKNIGQKKGRKRNQTSDCRRKEQL